LLVWVPFAEGGLVGEGVGVLGADPVQYVIVTVLPCGTFPGASDCEFTRGPGCAVQVGSG
jgi:hypothetical protein